jgi:hypothetical protein
MPDDGQTRDKANTLETKRYEEVRRWLFVGLSLTAVGCAIARVSGAASVDRDVLFFLVIAGVFLVLERIKKLNISKEGISYEVGEQIKEELTTVHEKMDKVQQVATENQRAITNGVGGKRRTEESSQAANQKGSLKLPEPVNSYDPQKGRFGGLSINKGRKLSAEVTPAQGYPGNYDVTLKVESIDPSKPLKGQVTFYLHHTFLRPVRVVSIKDGIALLELLAYGAFTAGAVADEGETLLELDLAEDERFPKQFRES